MFSGVPHVFRAVQVAGSLVWRAVCAVVVLQSCQDLQFDIILSVTCPGCLGLGGAARE